MTSNEHAAAPRSPLPWCLDKLANVPACADLLDANDRPVTSFCNTAGDYDIHEKDRAYLVVAVNKYPVALRALQDIKRHVNNYGATTDRALAKWLDALDSIVDKALDACVNKDTP